MPNARPCDRGMPLRGHMRRQDTLIRRPAHTHQTFSHHLSLSHVTSCTRPSPFSTLNRWEWPGDEARLHLVRTYLTHRKKCSLSHDAKLTRLFSICEGWDLTSLVYQTPSTGCITSPAWGREGLATLAAAGFL